MLHRNVVILLLESTASLFGLTTIRTSNPIRVIFAVCGSPPGIQGCYIQNFYETNFSRTAVRGSLRGRTAAIQQESNRARECSL
jgi:hypothetical protein